MPKSWDISNGEVMWMGEFNDGRAGRGPTQSTLRVFCIGPSSPPLRLRLPLYRSLPRVLAPPSSPALKSARLNPLLPVLYIHCTVPDPLRTIPASSMRAICSARETTKESRDSFSRPTNDLPPGV